ncbi:stabilin-2-like isoform X2 [Dysidea avara]|uniref:stabilin-2-like isoform X2 n=1 Tax=Dysidea avara TaxID=196820 RepID=UPI0033243750
MSALVFLVLLISCSSSIVRTQQQEGRCDITEPVVTYTSCLACRLNEFVSCPAGTTQTTTGQGISGCRIFLFITGCRHRCVSTRVVQERCCDGYWGTNCDPCPGLKDASGTCSGNGVCSSGIVGNGTCLCEDAFNGTNCELCSDETTYGLDCNSTCTCEFGECDNSIIGDGHCQPDTCELGFTGEDCNLELNTSACDDHDCGNNSYCAEYPNGTISCFCIADYHLNPDGGDDCVEIDRCDLGTDTCDDNATCYYISPNQFDCICNVGFTGDGVYCESVDPCQTNNGGCEENTTCLFAGPGMSSCECMEGFKNYQPSVGCSLINPCEDGTAGCSDLANCTLLSPGSALCTCRSGYTGNGMVCYGSLLEELQNLTDSGQYKLNTFVSLVYEYGLDRLLDRGGIFTIFVPTDEAFNFSMPFFSNEITLLTHIVPTQINVAGLSTVTNFVTMAGHVVEISASNYTVVDGNGSPVIVQSNLVAVNGFINVLDAVAIVPEDARVSNPNPIDLSAWILTVEWERLSSFNNLIQQANLIGNFHTSQNVTVLAPTNEAIAALPPGTISYLQSSHGTDDLVTIVNNHLVNGEVSIVDIVARRSLLTTENTRYSVAFGANGSISFGGVNLIVNNIRVFNGIVHVIDAVLKPPELDPIINRFCPSFNVTTTSTSCGSCLSIPSCPTGFTPRGLFFCFSGFSVGCGRRCIQNVTVSQCCDGFYGTDCLPCQENHVSPCSGNGQCFDGINGNGTCICNDSFTGSICEVCAGPNMFGSNCSQECTCINGICDEGPLGSGQCLTGSCNVGFTGDNCDIGVPHCGFLNDTCHVNAICQVVNNAEECTCRYGHSGDGIISCDPINLCLNLDRGGCHEQAVCRYDGPGEATCICNSGWSGDGTSCSPIDPCALPSRGGCDTNANCLFTAPGENSCSCNFGYRGDGTSCTAINSCTINRGGCHSQAICTSTGPGINDCACNDGYIGDGYNCIGSLLDEISNVPKASMFYELLQQSHLQSLFSVDNGNNYTVFVPSNAAIVNASQMQLDTWTTEHNVPLLIQHHVTSTTFSYDQLSDLTGTIPTILNDDVLVVTVYQVDNSTGNDTVFINNAGIDEYNYPARNGIFHIIDKVLFPDDSYLPPNLPPLVDVLRNSTEFTRLVALIEMFNLTDTLNSGTYTILAPTDAAISELTDEEIANLTVNVTLFHVYPGSLPVESIFSGLQLLPLLPFSGPLTFTIEDDTVFVNDVPLNGTDLHAANSSVILPLAGVLEPIYSRCDIINTTRVYGECGSCATVTARGCPQGSVFVQTDRTCTYQVRVLFFTITLRGCRQVCDDVDVTPRCCDGYYGPDCDACPQSKGNICSMRGSCNDTINGDGQCSCAGNYGGTACETCVDNMFGASCGQTCNCSDNGVCDDGVDGDGSCSCLPGWQGDDCTTLVNSTACGTGCHQYAYCDTIQPVCVCAEGYTGNGTYCTVIDVCAADNGGCAPEATCVSDPTSPGGRTCICQTGLYTGDGLICIPLDPCISAANGGCDPNARCVMTGPGQRVCTCNAGYNGDGIQSCDPINVCDQMVNGGCGVNAYCISTGPAQKKCVCNDNFAGDGYTCTATLRQLIATNPSLTTLDSYLNQMNSNGIRIGRFLTDVGPFTGFAISDTGYQLLMNSADNATLALYSNPDVLEKLVQYSFVSCAILSADQLNRTTTLTSVMGSIITVSASGDPPRVMVNNVELSTVDLVAHNGILHIMDTSVSPPREDLVVGNRTGGIVNVLQTNQFGTLASSIQLAGSDLVSLLSNPSLRPFTLFAPNEFAFRQLPTSLVARLLMPSNRALLERYVTYHIISGARLSPSDISKVTHLVTLQGGIIRVNCSNSGDLFINDNSRVVLREIAFDAGVIYGINRVLIPPGEGGDCDKAITLATWTNCSASCNLDCPDGYTPVTNSTSQLACVLPGDFSGCQQLCTASSFERRCCSGYYSSSCLACPSTTTGVCNGVVECDDGIDGTGCACPAPYTGQACGDCISGYNRNGSVCVSIYVTPTPTTMTATSTTTTMLVLTTTTAAATTTTTTTAVTTSPTSSSVTTTATSQSTMTTSQPSTTSSATTSSMSTSSTSMTTTSITSSSSTMTPSQFTMKASSSSMTTSPSSMTTTSQSTMTTSMTSSSSTMTPSQSSMTTSPSSMTTSPSSMTTSPSSMTTSPSSMTTSPASKMTTSSMVIGQSSISTSQTISSPVSSSSSTSPSQSAASPTIPAAKPGASTGGGSSTGVAVGVTLAVIILIIIVVVVIVLSLYLYNRKRGFLKVGGWTSNKQHDDNIMLTMDPPGSPASFDNPLYAGPGADYMSNPLYDGIDDEV